MVRQRQEQLMSKRGTHASKDSGHIKDSDAGQWQGRWICWSRETSSLREYSSGILTRGRKTDVTQRTNERHGKRLSSCSPTA